MRIRDSSYLSQLQDYYARYRYIPTYECLRKLWSLASRSSVSRVLDRLHRQGLIERTPDGEWVPARRFFVAGEIVDFNGSKSLTNVSVHLPLLTLIAQPYLRSERITNTVCAALSSAGFSAIADDFRTKAENNEDLLLLASEYVQLTIEDIAVGSGANNGIIF